MRNFLKLEPQRAVTPAVADARAPVTYTEAPTANEVVALVEDDPSARRLTRVWLEHAGYRVAEFDSSRAVREDEGELPSVVCVDLGLGDGSGFEVMEHL